MGMGEGDYGNRSHTAEQYSCLQVWVWFKEPFHVYEKRLWQRKMVEEKIGEKAVHFLRCHSTAWMATNCNINR